MPPFRDFRDLIVWQRAVDFIVEVYALSRTFPREERYGLTAQLRGAAVSISSNIAEGSGRSSLRDRRNFFGHSRGSLKEAESLLLVSQRLDFIDESGCKRAFDLSDEVSRMLTKMRQTLRDK